MSRDSRSTLARETVEICEAGFYAASDGGKVWLESAIREAKAKTVLYSPEDLPVGAVRSGGATMKWSVTSETTLGALIRMEGEAGGHLACLNFASAKNAGGGFLGGAEAQEESLARSSALYPCLLSAPAYYERNRACRTALYLDLAIWSPGVPFFRDDRGALLPKPVLASVITVPAPNAGAVLHNEPQRALEIEPVLARRAAFVLAIAAAQDVRRLVLGAWGCGVFRNDPRMVARVFAALLGPSGAFAGAFDEIVFAIYDKLPDRAVVRIFTEVIE